MTIFCGEFRQPVQECDYRGESCVVGLETVLSSLEQALLLRSRRGRSLPAPSRADRVVQLNQVFLLRQEPRELLGHVDSRPTLPVIQSPTVEDATEVV